MKKKLDVYEDYPALYKKYYFTYYGKKVMTYTMSQKTIFIYPTEKYLNIISKTGGLVLLLTGIAIVTGQLQKLGFFIQEYMFLVPLYCTLLTVILILS